MKIAFLLFGGLREYWWSTRVSDIINKIIILNDADVFMFFDKYSSDCNPTIKHKEFNYNLYTQDNEYESLYNLYGLYIKSLYLLSDSYNTTKFEFRQSNYNIINNYYLTGQIQKFNSQSPFDSIENTYHIHYQNKIKQILSKFEPWIESRPIEEKRLKINHIGRITDLYLKMFYCWKLMEEYECKNNFIYDRVIVARIDMLYDDIEFLPENDVIHFCEPWRPNYQMDCFYYGNRNLIKEVCTNLINEYGNFIDPEMSAMGEFNMGMIVQKYNIPINYIKYCPGSTEYGYKLFKT